MYVSIYIHLRSHTLKYTLIHSNTLKYTNNIHRQSNTIKYIHNNHIHSNIIKYSRNTQIHSHTHTYIYIERCHFRRISFVEKTCCLRADPLKSFIYLIYKAQNIYIYMFVPYRNPNRLTNLGEIWHRYIF